MLYALGQPVIFAGLLMAFLAALLFPALAIRTTVRWVGLAPEGATLRARPTEDLDPFGAVAAALGDIGWGRAVGVEQVPRHRGRVRAAAIFAAGPIAAPAGGGDPLRRVRHHVPGVRGVGPLPPLRRTARHCLGRPRRATDDIRGGGDALFRSAGVVPVPPLDGFGLFWTVRRRPGPRMRQARVWLAEKNVGIALLLFFLLFPGNYPLFFVPIDLLGTPLMRMWA